MVKMIVVGEAWGAREEMFQHAFVGSSGIELARMLIQAKIAPELPVPHPSELDMLKYWKILAEEHEILVTNVFNSRPQDNQIDLFFTNAKEGLTTLQPMLPGKYLRPELLPHLETLWQHIANVKPNLILALGNTACWATLGEGKISIIRGTVKNSPRLGIKVLPTYHPAAVLRQWNLRPIVVTDLEKARDESQFSKIQRIERYVTVEPTLDDIRLWAELPAAYYAVDIENPYGQISMIGFARSSDDALVIPFLDETKPDWNYWPNVKDEMSAWKLADKLLRKSVPKLFQNGIYDLTHLLRAGFRPEMCQDDTMLLHHSLYPEMLKSLGFLGSIYSKEIAWKTMRSKGNNLKRDE